MFDQGDLRLLILYLLSESPMHGYDVIKIIEQKSGGTYSPSPGVVYPNLTMLEELGHAKVAEEGSKKVYTITPDGKQHLRQSRAQVEHLIQRIGQVGGEVGASTPQIYRALDNLRAALQLRIAGGGLAEAEVRKIVDALDSAAKSIERS